MATDVTLPPFFSTGWCGERRQGRVAGEGRAAVADAVAEAVAIALAA
jgi:hypothetical protein